MKKALFINIILIFFACSNHQQKKIDNLKQEITINRNSNLYPSGKCDINYLAHIDSLIEQNFLTRNKILGLFETISDSCDNNVEFVEFSNEILLKALLNQPKIFIEELSRESETKQKTIINELKNPFSDKFDFEKIINKIEDTVTKNELQKILYFRNVDNVLITKTKEFLDKVMKGRYVPVNLTENNTLKIDHLKIFDSTGMNNAVGFVRSDYKKKKKVFIYENNSIFIIEYNNSTLAANSFNDLVNKNKLLRERISKRKETGGFIDNKTLKFMMSYCYGGNMIFQKDKYLISVVESCLEPKTKIKMNWKEYENLIKKEFLVNKKGKIYVLNSNCSDFYYQIEKY